MVYVCHCNLTFMVMTYLCIWLINMHYGLIMVMVLLVKVYAFGLRVFGLRVLC